jgi:hypothetical protein
MPRSSKRVCISMRSVVAVDGGPDAGFAAPAGASNAGEDGGDNLVAEGEQGSDGAGGGGWDVVSARAAGLADQPLAAQLPQVVRGLTDGQP